MARERYLLQEQMIVELPQPHSAEEAQGGLQWTHFVGRREYSRVYERAEYVQGLGEDCSEPLECEHFYLAL